MKFELTKNKKIGLLIIGIGLLIGYIIYSFNNVLNKVISTSDSCNIDNCPHEVALNLQTNISLILLFIVICIGIVFLFLKEKKQTKVLKEVDEEKLKELNDEERKIYALIKGEGSIFQSDLVEKTQFDKVKITRILDRLEGKQLIERKRRGMTNIVILK